MNGVSFNNQCFKGPDLVNSLLGVLLRSRLYKYAFLADIESMFLQVKIPPVDRNALRFLWKVGYTELEYRMKSHLFGGVFCSSSSTYALRRTADEFSNSQLVRDTIYNDFYVDDELTSLPTLGKAIEVITGVKTALKQGGFNLRSYVVNDYKLLEFIPTSDIADNVKCLILDIMSKALGTHWNVTNDVFYYIAKHSRQIPTPWLRVATL